MTLAGAEWAVRFAGLVVFAFAAASAVARAVGGGSRAAGRAAGLARLWRAHTVYLISAVPYFAVCVLLWRPLPLEPSAPVRVGALVAGAMVGAAGASLYLLGRRELGRTYNVSSSLGSELYADHALVTSGPYAWCRHPMYAGLALSAVGALLVYRTWTIVFMCGALAGAATKARIEERLLSEQFGEAWERYRDTVPRWMPRRPQPLTEEVNHGRRAAA